MEKILPNKIPPRKVPSRDDYYMGLAFWIASKSKDPNTQVGAIIVSESNKPLGSGYNGPPSEIDDNKINWGRERAADYMFKKYFVMKHAEDNAIDHSNRDKLYNATLYVTAPPCDECMKDISSAGIKRVVYFVPESDNNSTLSNDEIWKQTQEIANLSNISLEEFSGDLNWMRDRIIWMDSMGVFN